MEVGGDKGCEGGLGPQLWSVITRKTDQTDWRL